MNFTTALQAKKDANLYRTLRTMTTAQGRKTKIEGKPALLFSSNSYLGLAEEPYIVRRVMRAIELYGTGSGGSRLVTGNSILHMELEKLLADFKGFEASLVFTSGYAANLGAITALAGEDSFIFSDELNHASIIDGCRLARGKTVTYRHNDPDDLVGKIRQAQISKDSGKGLIVTDSVFSMNGDIAPLPKLVQIKEEFGLMLMVDDAHATGVLGNTGRGSLEHFGLASGDVDVLMGTLSKAIPSEGGFICGSEELCDWLRNTARSFIYTTASSPGTVAASMGGIEYVRDHPERVQRLRDNVQYFAGRLAELDIPCTGETPIIPVMVGDEEEALRMSESLFDLGVFVPCIRYPTVAKGRARLRFTLMATHIREDMDHVADCLKKHKLLSLFCHS